MISSHGSQGVGGSLEGVIEGIGAAGLQRRGLLADRHHGRAEAVELSERLAFRGFHHHRARHWPAHRGGMEAVVHQALGQIIDLQAAAALERPQIEDALVGHAPASAPVKHGKMGLQALGQQVGGQQGHLAGLAQARAAHHADVHPADCQNRSTAQGCRSHGPHPSALSPCGTRQEGQ